MSKVIFSTVHGSYLYGLADEDSDRDLFYVTDSTRAKARHSFADVLDEETPGAKGWDQVRVGLKAFLLRVQEGSHQSVEALFSPRKKWNPEFEYLRPMLESYRVTGSEVFAKYERTITKFCYGDFKRRRHAVRLAFNLLHLRSEGRFNPVMDEAQISTANGAAEEWEGEQLRLFTDRIWRFGGDDGDC